MKLVFKLVALLALISSLALVFFTSFGNPASALSNNDDDSTYLFAGFDDVAQNTDVLCLVTFGGGADFIRVLQIPRDTYYDFGGVQNKINQLFASMRAKGKTTEESMVALKDALSAQLSIPIHGYIGISTKAFKSMVNAIGGVDIELDKNLSIYDGVLELKQGKNHLNAEDALTFVRYRKGYANADLGRLDAQKIFIKGLFDTVKDISLFKLIKLLVSARDLVTDFKFTRMFSLIGRGVDLKKMTVSSVTLPGAPVLDSKGISYYVLNKKANEELLEKYYSIGKDAFDKSGLFVKADDEKFYDIYNSTKIGFVEYYGGPINIQS